MQKKITKFQPLTQICSFVLFIIDLQDRYYFLRYIRCSVLTVRLDNNFSIRENRSMTLPTLFLEFKPDAVEIHFRFISCILIVLAQFLQVHDQIQPKIKYHISDSNFCQGNSSATIIVLLYHSYNLSQTFPGYFNRFGSEDNKFPVFKNINCFSFDPNRKRVCTG